jgi:hypothetical protein
MLLKKSLISAALIALSSVSAFADSESSFYLGVKGLYFMPKKEHNESSYNIPGTPINISNFVECKTRGIFLPGLQFGYNISDSVRIGLAGYFGASKFKYEVDIDPLNDRLTQACAQLLEAVVAAAAAAATTVVTPAQVAVLSGNSAALKAGLVSAINSYKGKAEAAQIMPGVGVQDPQASAAFVNAWTAAGGAPLSDLEVALAGGIVTANPAPLLKGTTCELGPRFVLFATMDAKLFESDSFSLGMGLGVGAAKWKASVNVESQSNGAPQNASEDYSAWKPAFMGTVNANVNIGDVAVLTGSIGYAHLGNPKGLKSSDDQLPDMDADSNKAKGFIFGIGIGKEF